MKTSKCASLLLIAATLVAASEAESTQLYKAEESTRKDTEGSHQTELPKGQRQSKRTSTSITTNSLDTKVRSWSMIASGSTVVTSSSATDYFDQVKIGQILKAEIPMSVMAFADAKAPVVANVTLPSGEVVRALGEATVERNSKRISISFVKLRAGEKVFDFKSNALDGDGTYGLEGEVHSGTGKFFLASLITAAAAAFTDSTINRSSNILGNQVEENSLDTSGKKAVVGALGKSGEFFAEKLKDTKEWVSIDGPVTVHLIILEEPKRSASKVSP